MKYEIWKHQDLNPNFGAIYLEFRTLYPNLKWLNNWSDRNHRYRTWGLYQSFPSLSESFFLLREMWLELVGGCWRGVGCEINGLISLYQDLTRQLHFSEIWQTDAGGGQGGEKEQLMTSGGRESPLWPELLPLKYFGITSSKTNLCA